MDNSSWENNYLAESLERRGLVVNMNEDQVSNNRIRLSRCLLGTIRDAEFFSTNRVQNYVESCWHLRGNVDVESRGSIYLFSFTNEDDMDDIVVRSPFNINGALLLITHWTPNIIFQRFEIAHANIWMQLHGIPTEYFTEENIRSLARIAGPVNVVDWNADGAQALKFVRVLIRILVASPLIPGTFLQTMERTRIWVSFRYEKVFRVCYHCGRIGHSTLHCRFTGEEALTCFLDHLFINNADNNYEYTADFDAPLYNHMIRAMPNTEEYMNSTVYLLDPLTESSPENEQHYYTAVEDGVNPDPPNP